jgi:ArsR family transcriptional regulator
VTPIAAAAEACPPLLQGALTDAEAQKLSAALKVIANPARLRLLSLIHAQPDHEACVCHLIAPLGLSQSTVSHHLKVLHDAELLEREQRGTWVFYRALPDGLAPLLDLLS